MEDKYLYFTFDNVNSSYYNCFYINSGEDLVFPAFPAFSDQKSSPLFQQHTYYLGTSIEDRTIPLNCACENLTMAQFKQLQSWLAIDKIGELKLDFLKHYHFNVKISSFSDITFLPMANNRFHCTFSISFTTIEDYAAISDKEYELDIKKSNEGHFLDIPYSEFIDINYRLPLIDGNFTSKILPVDNKEVGIRLFNYDTFEYYPIFENKNIIDFEVKKFNQKYPLRNNNTFFNQLYSYKFSGQMASLDVDGRLGFATRNGELIEKVLLEENEEIGNFINNGTCSVESGDLKQSTLKLINKSQTSTADGKIVLKLDFEINDNFTYNNFNYGSIDDNGYIEENKNFKCTFIQHEDVLDYNLYNENGYDEKKYYANPQPLYKSYYFNTTGKILSIELDESSGDSMSNIENDMKIGQKYIVSIANYTQLNLTLLSAGANVALAKSKIKFNLRTVF